MSTDVSFLVSLTVTAKTVTGDVPTGEVRAKRERQQLKDDKDSLTKL